MRDGRIPNLSEFNNLLTGHKEYKKDHCDKLAQLKDTNLVCPLEQYSLTHTIPNLPLKTSNGTNSTVY